MASGPTSVGSTVPQLMSTVKQLAPSELREFKRQFAEWLQHSGEEETILVQACRARLPAAETRRLEKLIAKSERGSLSPHELQAYRILVRRAEKLDATRLAALTQLACRLGKPVCLVMEIIGWESGEDETTGHSARRAKAGARTRR